MGKPQGDKLKYRPIFRVTERVKIALDNPVNSPFAGED
jgi:hypothetical protein